MASDIQEDQTTFLTHPSGLTFFNCTNGTKKKKKKKQLKIKAKNL